MKFFASIKLTVFCLLWLAVLTVWGTVYQVNNGIYLAQDRFFYSFILYWVLPGGMLTMILLFLNLVTSFFVHYQAGWKMPGLMLIHLGLILLLTGGFFTMVSGTEARVQLLEGEGTNTAFDVSEWEISSTSDLGAPRDVQAVYLDGMNRKDWFRFGGEEGVKYTVLDVYENATGFKGENLSAEAEAQLPKSASGFHALQPEKPEKKPTDNTPGVRLKVEGADNVEEIILWGNDPLAVRVVRPDGQDDFVQLRRRRYQLPFFIELLEFEHSYYPGSSVPKDFRSRVLIQQGEDRSQGVEISMNNPYRGGGWTFFQHSFGSSADNEMSEFAVTRKMGRLIPYWATGITSVGLAMHFLQMQLIQLKQRRRRQS